MTQAVKQTTGSQQLSAVRKPLVNIAGKIRQLPSGDTLPPQQPAAHTHSISEIGGLRSELDSLAGGGGGGGGIPDAPYDGKTYGRKNGVWERVIGFSDDPGTDLKDYLLGSPSGAQLDTMLSSLYWRFGLNDLLSQPDRLADVFADAEAMQSICTSAEAYRTVMQSPSATQFMAATGLTPVVNPVMTSATTPSGVASASSIYSTGYAAYYAFDGSNSIWCSESGAPINQQWLRYDFPTPVFLHSLDVTPGTDEPMKDFRMEYSDDGTSWLTAMTGKFPYGSISAIHKIEQPLGQHRYWRIFAITSHGSRYVTLAEVKFRGFTW